MVNPGLLERLLDDIRIGIHTKLTTGGYNDIGMHLPSMIASVRFLLLSHGVSAGQWRHRYTAFPVAFRLPEGPSLGGSG